MVAESPFHGSTVILRAIEPGDAGLLHGWMNHPDVLGCRYAAWETPDYAPLSTAQVEGILQEWAGAKNELHLMVTLRKDETPIGYAACDWGWDAHTQGVSVVIAPPYRRKGYGSEALRLLLGYQFGYSPAHSIACWMADWNEPGRRFAARNGFREVGCLRRAGMRAGAFYDTVTADLLRPEWEALCGGENNAS